MRMRTLIVDDERVARQGLRAMLNADERIVVVGECEGGEEAIAAIRDLEPDLIFLDVEMPEVDGFEVLDRHGVEPPPAVVFVTAYDQYALNAFEVQAVDYLLKPFTDDRLREAVDRAERQGQASGMIRRLHRRLDAIMERMLEQEQSPQYLQRIPVKESGRVVLIDVDDVDWIEAADNYVALHVGKRSHLLRRTMSEMERQLDPARFIRIHRSRIVNIERIREVHPQSSGDSVIVLRNGVHLNSSRTYSHKRRQMFSPLSS